MKSPKDPTSVDASLAQAIEGHFLEDHTHALAEYLAPHAQEEFKVLSVVEQKILEDMLALQQRLPLEALHSEEELFVNKFLADHAGVLKRAQTPMLQLIRDNEQLLLKLLRLWKNMCAFLGLQIGKNSKLNRETLAYQLGVHALQPQLNVFRFCLQQLVRQRQLIEKKLRKIKHYFKKKPLEDEEQLEALEELIEKAIYAVHPGEHSLDQQMFDVEKVYEGDRESLNQRLRQPTAALLLAAPILVDENQKSLEYFLGVEQTNRFINQVEILQIRGNAFLNQQRQLHQSILALEEKLHPKLFLDESLQAKPRLQRDISAYRTLFHPEPGGSK